MILYFLRNQIKIFEQLIIKYAINLLNNHIHYICVFFDDLNKKKMKKNKY